jgi:hypothetical protein
MFPTKHQKMFEERKKDDMMPSAMIIMKKMKTFLGKFYALKVFSFAKKKKNIFCIPFCEIKF